MYIYIYIYIFIYLEREREWEREKERERRDRQTDRQTDRRTDRDKISFMLIIHWQLARTIMVVMVVTDVLVSDPDTIN